MASGGDSFASTTTTKAYENGGGGGPIIRESQESAEYQRALQTVVGTALGVIFLVGLLALSFFLYRLRCQRQRLNLDNGLQHSPSLNRSITIDVGSKPVPMVLVLYAYDCAVHEAVVVALAGLLMEVCGVAISLDVLEEAVIQEQGLEDWLGDRLQEADFILVVCSIGARLRCSKKRARFRAEAGRSLPDYFAVAVDYVAEKLRAEKSKGLGANKFLTVVMDYSRFSDVPPQLEASSSYCLMRDFSALCAHVSAPSPNHVNKSVGSGDNGTDAWKGTEAGAELWAALGQARDYFKAHPNWLEERLEPLPPRIPQQTRRRRQRHREHSSQEQPLLPLDVSTDVVNSNVNACPNTLMRVHNIQNGGAFVHSRQNSLPSSLCASHPPVSVPHVQVMSRSVDSFPTQDPLEFGERSVCLMCQQEQQGWTSLGRKLRCKVHHAESPPAAAMHSDTDGEMEMEGKLDEQRLLSKSVPIMPLDTPSASHSLQTVHKGLTTTSHLSNSRQVLQAEVHKEWDGNKDIKNNWDMDKFETTQEWVGHGSGSSTRNWISPNKDFNRDWDFENEFDADKEWRSHFVASGRNSPSSLSSNSASHAGSDSLELDLLSITVPRIFRYNQDSKMTTIPPPPPRSISSSAVMSGSDFQLRPVALLTPVQPVSSYDFNLFIQSIQPPMVSSHSNKRDEFSLVSDSKDCILKV